MKYLQNPNGYYQHSWMVGIGLSILGIIFIGLGYFKTVFSRKKKKQLEAGSLKIQRFNDVNIQPEKVTLDQISLI